MDEYFWEAAKLLREKRRVEHKAMTNNGATFDDLRHAAARPDHYVWKQIDEAIPTACASPDHPMEFSRDLTCFLNFGTTPDLLKADLALTHAQRQKQTLDPQAPPALSEELRAYHSRIIQTMERQYAETQAASNVYNIEPWLQEMYRDVLDVDARESIWRRVEGIEHEMAAVPDRLLTLGLPGEVVGDIMNALSEFNTIQDESREREKRKISVSDPRRYAEVIGRIEKEMERAETHVPSLRQGRQSAMRDLFTAWKEATYELVDLKRSAHQMWLSDRMDENTRRMQGLLQALRRTLRRCADDAGTVPCSLIGAKEGLDLVPRPMVERCLRSLQMFDLIPPTDMTTDRMERRKFGPLSILLAPGAGVPRYSEELRSAFEAVRSGTESDESRDSNDIAHRAQYPHNYLVVPSLASRDRLLVTLADAFLEYKSIGTPSAYRATLEDLRRQIPQVFELDIECATRNPSRARFAYYLAGFLQWAGTGTMPNLQHLPAFVKWARARLKTNTLLANPRRLPVLRDFIEGSPVRRQRIFLQIMAGRFEADAQRLALRILARDVRGALEAARFLPTSLREHSCLRKAAEGFEEQQPGYHTQAVSQLRRFVFADSELARIFLGMEARIGAEVSAMRERVARQQGREMTYENAVEAIRVHYEKAFEKKRDTAHAHMDRGLLGLLYAMDGNPAVALEELRASLETMIRLAQTKRGDTQTAPVGEVLSKLGCRHLQTDNEASVQAMGQTRTIGQQVFLQAREDEFVLYNIGALAVACRKPGMAEKYLGRFIEDGRRTGWWLFGEHAREMLARMTASLGAPSSPPKEPETDGR